MEEIESSWGGNESEFEVIQGAGNSFKTSPSLMQLLIWTHGDLLGSGLHRCLAVSVAGALAPFLRAGLLVSWMLCLSQPLEPPCSRGTIWPAQLCSSYERAGSFPALAPQLPGTRHVSHCWPLRAPLLLGLGGGVPNPKVHIVQEGVIFSL